MPISLITVRRLQILLGADDKGCGETGNASNVVGDKKENNEDYGVVHLDTPVLLLVDFSISGRLFEFEGYSIGVFLEFVLICSCVLSLGPPLFDNFFSER